MAESEKSLNRQREILKLPYLVLSVSLLITLGATFIFYQSSRSKDASRFQSAVMSINNRIEILLRNHIATIKAGRAFVESSQEINQQKFADFVNSLEIISDSSSIQGIGFTKKTSLIKRVDFLKNITIDKQKDNSLEGSTKLGEYETVIYSAPLNKLNQYSIGFDMNQDPVCLEAMEKANQTGEASVTGKVDLKQENKAQQRSGFLIFLPVYQDGKTPLTAEERRALLQGYIYSPFTADDFLREVQNSMALSDIGVTIYEGERRPENILAQTERNNDGEFEKFTTFTDLNVGGRKWTVEYQSLPSFIMHSTTGWTPLIFISGLALSLLLFGMTYFEAFARARAEKITGELQDSEREKAFLLEREQNERRRAEAANKAKDEFMSVVSHELRTPLNAIAGWTKILYAENLSPATRKQALQKIDKNLRMQTEIVEQILEFSQILSGKSHLSRQEVDVSKMFEEVFEQVNLAAKEKGIIFNKNNSLNGQKIRGDQQRLQTVVKNLLANAVKFTPKGGAVSADLNEKDNGIEIIIKDNGQGIKAEFLPYIFEHFKQADSSLTRRHGGLGLGLAITRHIVQLHGGSINAASEGEGKGAVFTIELPNN